MMTKNTEERTLIQTILYYFSVIFQYKWFIIIMTFIAAVGVVGFSIMTLRLPAGKNPMPNVYTTDAVMIMESSESSGFGELMTTMGYADTSTKTNDMEMALEVLRSRKFHEEIVTLMQALGHLNIVRDAEEPPVEMKTLRNIVKNSLKIFGDKNGNKLTFFCTSTDPKFARDLINVSIDHLQLWFDEAKGKSEKDSIALMEQTLAEMNGKMKELQSEIEAFQKKYKVLSVEELAATQNELVNTMRIELVSVDKEISDYESFSRVEDSALKRLRAKKAGLVSLINKIENGYDGNNYSLPKKGQLPELAKTFARKSTDLAIQMKLYETVAERYEVAKLAEAPKSPFYVLQYAELPTEKSGPSRGDLCIKITLMAFAGSIGLVLAFHILKSILMDPKNIRYLKGAKN